MENKSLPFDADGIATHVAHVIECDRCGTRIPGVQGNPDIWIGDVRLCSRCRDLMLVNQYKQSTEAGWLSWVRVYASDGELLEARKWIIDAVGTQRLNDDDLRDITFKERNNVSLEMDRIRRAAASWAASAIVSWVLLIFVTAFLLLRY